MEVLGTEVYKAWFMLKQQGMDIYILHKSDKTLLALDMGEEDSKSAQNGSPWMSRQPQVYSDVICYITMFGRVLLLYDSI